MIEGTATAVSFVVTHVLGGQELNPPTQVYGKSHCKARDDRNGEELKGHVGQHQEDTMGAPIHRSMYLS